ncbi:hypothetical protein OnM2_015031 [Erysiphe neolycopersici]|uniref:Uncharacterized protein n=1 Tax=Erysiphe neolycopersici TaxID=212602 RepID=A0A420I5I8_9PEZI|nr:hypothetical protein OnM2_015031 [Erysiphe neolycopersici]
MFEFIFPILSKLARYVSPSLASPPSTVRSGSTRRSPPLLSTLSCPGDSTTSNSPSPACNCPMPTSRNTHRVSPVFPASRTPLPGSCSSYRHSSRTSPTQPDLTFAFPSPRNSSLMSFWKTSFTRKSRGSGTIGPSSSRLGLFLDKPGRLLRLLIQGVQRLQYPSLGLNHLRQEASHK